MSEEKKTDTLDADIKAAREIQKRRMGAPLMGTDELMIEQKQLIKTFAPDCVGGYDPKTKKSVDPAMHAFFGAGDEQSHRQYVDSMGYEPVKIPGTDRQVTTRTGDKLYKLPHSLYLRSLKGPADEANKRAIGTRSDIKKSNKDAVEETMEQTKPTSE